MNSFSVDIILMTLLASSGLTQKQLPYRKMNYLTHGPTFEQRTDDSISSPFTLHNMYLDLAIKLTFSPR